jgi:quercetin dioxygenase-like cupin family protein
MEQNKKLIKNVNWGEVYNILDMVDYNPGQVVSRTLAQGKNMSMTLFAFDKGEEISAHSSPGDALVSILDGAARITIGDKEVVVKAGQVVVMPAGVPHALYAKERFKMLLIVVFQP